MNLIIEIDGDQHFRQVWNLKSPEIQQERDLFKMKLAKGKGYTIIRIYQPDIYYNKNNWDNLVKQEIKNHECPSVICIGDKFIE